MIIMESKQTIFTEDYCTLISQSLKAGLTIPNYTLGGDKFVFTDKDTCTLNNFNVDKDKLTMLNEGTYTSLEAAIMLFEAFPDLNPLLASYAPFWFYISHVELIDYMRRRWPHVYVDRDGDPNDEKEQIEYIKDYWFPDTGSKSKTWLTNLWWAVYLTVDYRREDKYALTKILFKQEDLRTRTLGTYLLFRHKPATIATLSFIESHLNTTFEHSFQNRCRYMTKYLNYLGGCRLISYMDEEFFTEMLNRKNEDTSKIN